MVYKCKICGGQTTVDAKSGIAVCEYCGTKQALPLFSADSERLLYDRGNNYLLHSEYDKAENVFNQLLTIKPGAAELYWDLVLCKYGVTYVKDPKTGKYIPTCNRTHYTPIFSDENYKRAIELSAGEKKALFEEDAKTIDNIQKGIIAVSKKEKPFDIFISYKETDASGNRTEDSIAAQDLYEKLTEAGYKVFFSRITLEDKVGIQYEPYIYAALSSSKVMLTVSSSRENIEAAWVKNEWSRYLTLRQSDAQKTLIPLYFNMPRSDLPEEFAILMAQDMKKEGFEQELIRGIKKLIPLPIMLAQKRKKLKKALGTTAAILGAIVIAVTAIFLPGYINEKRYTEAQQLFENAKYEDAFAAFSELEDYKDSKEMARNCTIQPDYDAAMQLFESGSYAEAAQAFEKLGDYADAIQRKEQAETAQTEIIKTQEYNAAMQLYYDGNYAGAAWAFKELAGFKDATEMQDKAERDWRDTLSSVVATVTAPESSLGTYHISPNGQVKNIANSPGSAHQGVDINSHGEIVSITENYALYALYEDGYVHNSAKNNGLEADWEDVIQITPRFHATNVALKSDGTVVYGKMEAEYASDTDHWLEPVSTWKDIVSLSWHIQRNFFEGTLSTAFLVGVDIHGNAHSVYYCEPNYAAVTKMETAAERISSLTNIKNIVVRVPGYFDEPGELSFAALDGENSLISYRNGTLKTENSAAYKKVALNIFNELLVLNGKGEVLNWDKGTTVKDDVVYIDPSNNFVMRSGTIEGYNEKTQVRDVWLKEN